MGRCSAVFTMLQEFVTAYVAQPFGVEGFVKVRSISGETEHLRTRTDLWLRFTTEQGGHTKIKEKANELQCSAVSPHYLACHFH